MAVEKLVRDRVPELMPQHRYRVAADEERNTFLRQALMERVDMFVAGGEPQHLAEVLDLVHELADDMNVTPAMLDAHRRATRINRGGFYRSFLMQIRS